MTVYVCHTEPAHPKCPWGRRYVHHRLDVISNDGEIVVGTNELGYVLAFYVHEVIFTEFAYHMKKEQADREFHSSRRY